MRAEAPQRFTAFPFAERSEDDKEVCHENCVQGTRGFDADLCPAGLLLLRWSRGRQLLDDFLVGSEPCTSYSAQRVHNVACRTGDDHTRWHNDGTGSCDAISQITWPRRSRCLNPWERDREMVERGTCVVPVILDGASALSPFRPRHRFGCVEVLFRHVASGRSVRAARANKKTDVDVGLLRRSSTIRGIRRRHEFDTPVRSGLSCERTRHMDTACHRNKCRNLRSFRLAHVLPSN